MSQNSSLKEEAENAPHVRCKATLEAHVSSRGGKKAKKRAEKIGYVFVGGRTERWCGRLCGEDGKEDGRM